MDFFKMMLIPLVLGLLFTIRETSLVVAVVVFIGVVALAFSKIDTGAKIFISFWGLLICGAQMQSYIDQGKPRSTPDFAVSSPTQSGSGMCDHSWQTAADGSVCGKRAADQR